MILRRIHRLAAVGLVCLAAAAAADAAVIRLKVTAELANVRLRPSIASPIVRQIPEGALLEATRKDGEWYLVKIEPDETGTAQGYVHESLVLVLDAAAPEGKKPAVVDKPRPLQPKPAERPARETAEAPAEFPTPKPSIVLSTGGVYSLIGDLNDGVLGLADYVAFAVGAPGDMEPSALHFAFHFGAEVQIPLSRRFSLTIGTEYYGTTRESEISYSSGGIVDTLTVTPEFSSFPIKIGIAYYPLPNVYVKAGLFYTLAKMVYAYRYVHQDFWQEWTGSATAGGPGLFGGLGWEWEATSNLGIVVEIVSHYAVIQGFEGTGTFEDSTMTEPAEETGTLYSYLGNPTALDSFPLLFIRDKLPTESGVSGAREAKLDLTGISLRLGLKIKF